jgi:hypothetical protein
MFEIYNKYYHIQKNLPSTVFKENPITFYSNKEMFLGSGGYKNKQKLFCKWTNSFANR